MKKYNRETKKYEEEKPMTSLKKPETCKGKKPHDFVLLIPPYISRHRPYSKDEVEEYYAIEVARTEYDKELNERLEKLGIHSWRWNGDNRQYYRCAVCGKERYN